MGGVGQSTGYRAVVVCHESGHRKLDTAKNKKHGTTGYAEVRTTYDLHDDMVTDRWQMSSCGVKKSTATITNRSNVPGPIATVKRQSDHASSSSKCVEEPCERTSLRNGERCDA